MDGVKSIDIDLMVHERILALRWPINQPEHWITASLLIACGAGMNRAIGIKPALLA